MSTIGSDMLSLREEIKTLKNQIEIKENLSLSDKQITLFERTQATTQEVPAFRQVAQVSKSLFFLTL